MVRARDNREPRGPPTPSPTPRVLKCRALLYTGENLLLRSGKLRKREHLFSVSYLCSLSSPAPGLCSPLSRLVHPFLFHFSSPCLPPAPVFASLSRPRAFFLSLSLGSTLVAFSQSSTLSYHFLFLSRLARGRAS